MKKKELIKGMTVVWMDEGELHTGTLKSNPATDFASVIVPSGRMKVHYTRLMKGQTCAKVN